jgi:hypothetical protein
VSSAARRLLAVADALPVLLLAAIAGAGSFTHIRDTAAQHGQRGPMSWAVAVCIDLTCWMAARERQRDKRLGITTRRLSWPTAVLAGGVGLSLAANLAQAQPTAWGQVVAATPSAAFLVAVSMIERRAVRPAPASPAVPGQDEAASTPSRPGQPSPESQDGSPQSQDGQDEDLLVLPAAPPPTTRTSTASPSPATRCAPASASPPRPSPACCDSSAPASTACHPVSPALIPHDTGLKASSRRPARVPRWPAMDDTPAGQDEAAQARPAARRAVPVTGRPGRRLPCPAASRSP